MMEPVKASAFRTGDNARRGMFCPIRCEYGQCSMSSKTIEVTTCKYDDDDQDCDPPTDQDIGFPYFIERIEECVEYQALVNWQQRVKSCMPWETKEMSHLLKQFPSFAMGEENKPVPREGRVAKCDAGADAIHFSDSACWYSDSDMLFLKPSYKFSYKESTDSRICRMTRDSTTLAGVVQGTSVLYDNRNLRYTERPKNRRVWTECKYIGKASGTEWITWIPGVSNTLPDVTRYAPIQYWDYSLDSSDAVCPDFLTKPCFDNAFSFFGRVCAWVRASAASDGVKLASILQMYPAADRDSFVAYGNSGVFVVDAPTKNVDLWVNGAAWDGTRRQMRPDSTLTVKEKSGFSCTGCDLIGFAPDPTAPKASCGVPQKCAQCLVSHRVFLPGTWSPCDPSFATRTCVACPDHHVRSATTETECVACDALDRMKPARKKGEASCSVCAIGQYFDAKSLDGCVNLMSVAQGLRVGADKVAAFDARFVDQYIPADESPPPQTVPARFYRDIMADGRPWNSSTIAQMCSPVSFLVLGLSATETFARNVNGMRVHFRRWCGHAEILASNDALLDRLRCVQGASEVNVASNRSVSLQELHASQRTQANYVLKYERNVINNRVAEVKHEAGAISCYYEIRRMGRTQECTYCQGSFYTRDCGPTYNPALPTPATAGPGVCESCVPRCSDIDSFFVVSEFSCWSNGSARVQSVNPNDRDNLELISANLSRSMNYWYKPAECMPCAQLDDASVQKIVTTCGNKIWFEIWHPKEAELVLGVMRPRKRFCCALDSGVSSARLFYDSELRTSCVNEWTDVNLILLKQGTPACMQFVPDLRTEYRPFCPSGWYLDK